MNDIILHQKIVLTVSQCCTTLWSLTGILFRVKQSPVSYVLERALSFSLTCSGKDDVLPGQFVSGKEYRNGDQFVWWSSASRPCGNFLLFSAFRPTINASVFLQNYCCLYIYSSLSFCHYHSAAPGFTIACTQVKFIVTNCAIYSSVHRHLRSADNRSGENTKQIQRWVLFRPGS